MPYVRPPVFLIGVLFVAGSWIGCATSAREREAKFLKRGADLLAQKDFSRAALEFRNAAEVMPDDAEPHYQMGLAHLGAGYFQAAGSEFSKALDRNPKHAGARLKLAGLLTTSRDSAVLEQAEKELQALAAGPDPNVETLDALAMTEWKLGKPEDAAGLMERALQKFPSDLQSAVLLARFKLSRNDPAGAEAVLKRATAADPNSSQAALALADFYFHARDFGKAESELRRALRSDPKDVPALFRLGMIQENTNRPEQAEETYKQISQLPEKDYRSVYGAFLFRRGQKEAALAEFQRLFKQDPDDRTALTQLVGAYVSMNNIPEAEKVLADALKRNEKDTGALLERSWLRLKAGDYTTAEKDLNQVLQLEPDSAPAHFQLAQVRRMRGLPRSERDELNKAVSHDQTNLAARFALYLSFIRAGEFQAALNLIDQTPPPQKDSLAILAARNWALLRLGKTEDAREGIRLGLRTVKLPALLTQDGILKLKDRDYNGARTDAEELLSQNPEDQQGLTILVASYAGEKELPKAAVRIRELISRRPNSAQLYVRLGQILMASGNRAEAEKAFETAESIAPALAAPKIALADLDLAQNRLDAAKQQVNAAIALEPRNVTTLLMAADIDMRQGDRTAALAKCRSVLQIDESNVPALNNEAYLLALDNPDEALKLAQRAMEIAPDNPAVQDTLGWVYYRKAIYWSAVQCLKAATVKEPTPRRQFHLGMAYLKAGDRDLGQRTILAALKQDPNLAKKETGW